MGYHALRKCGRLLLSNNLRPVSVFYEFTGTINHKFLINQNARTIFVMQTVLEDPSSRKDSLHVN